MKDKIIKLGIAVVAVGLTGGLLLFPVKEEKVSFESVPTQTVLTGTSSSPQLWTAALAQKPMTKTLEIWWDSIPTKLEYIGLLTTTAWIDMRAVYGANTYYMSTHFNFQAPDLPYEGLYSKVTVYWPYIEPGEYALYGKVRWTLESTSTIIMNDTTVVTQVLGKEVYLGQGKVPYYTYLPLVLK